MKVQQTTTHCQAHPLPRCQKKIELEKYRLEKKIRKFNLPELIKSTFTMRKAPNSKYQSQELLDFLVEAQILGLFRFEHINDLEKTSLRALPINSGRQ